VLCGVPARLSIVSKKKKDLQFNKKRYKRNEAEEWRTGEWANTRCLTEEGKKVEKTKTL